MSKPKQKYLTPDEYERRIEIGGYIMSGIALVVAILVYLFK
jgi:hypothetical protein